MPELSCTVQTCVHNYQYLCELDKIQVGGNSAKNAQETCCDSFEERTGCHINDGRSAIFILKCYFWHNIISPYFLKKPCRPNAGLRGLLFRLLGSKNAAHFYFPLAPESHLCFAHLPQLTLCQRFCQLIGSKNATHFYR